MNLPLLQQEIRSTVRELEQTAREIHAVLQKVHQKDGSENGCLLKIITYIVFILCLFTLSYTMYILKPSYMIFLDQLIHLSLFNLK